MRVIHMISGLDRSHGGPSYSVPRLVQGLVGEGVDARLFVDRDHSEQAEVNGDFVEFFPRDYATIPLVRKLNFSRALARALLRPEQPISVIHKHGLWRMPNIYAARAASCRGGIPLVVSPRGMLGPAALNFSAKQKKLFWWLAQRPALRATTCFHATSFQEYEEIRALGLLAPVAVVPNGVDVPPRQEMNSTRRSPAARPRTVLFLSRLHGKKNVEGLLGAWSRIHADFPEWKLDLAGTGEPKYIAKLQQKVREMGLPRVSFLGALYGANKWDAFRDAELFVLPTLNENFGIAVAESLACGTPAIVTKGAPWAGLETERCGWWIDHGIDALAASLRNAMKLPTNVLSQMGARGAEWVERDFSWDSIAAQMAAVYRWLACGSAPPESVTLK